MRTKQDYVIKQIATYWSHDSLSLYKIWTGLVKLFLSYSRNNPTLTNIWTVLSLTVDSDPEVYGQRLASIPSVILLSTSIIFGSSTSPCTTSIQPLTRLQSTRSTANCLPPWLGLPLLLEVQSILSSRFLLLSPNLHISQWPATIIPHILLADILLVTLGLTCGPTFLYHYRGTQQHWRIPCINCLILYCSHHHSSSSNHAFRMHGWGSHCWKVTEISCEPDIYC